VKLTVTIAGIVLVLSLFLGYIAYESLSSRLEAERKIRQDKELELEIVLHKYLVILSVVERRQTNVERIVTYSKELDTTFDNLREYNADAQVVMPAKQRLAIGGSP